MRIRDVWGRAQVISTSGDTHLGGEDFDHRVMDYFVKLIKKKFKVDVSGDNRAMQKLRREAERAKRALSSSPQVRSIGFGLWSKVCIAGLSNPVLWSTVSTCKMEIGKQLHDLRRPGLYV